MLQYCFLFLILVNTFLFSQGYICAVGGGSEDYNSWSDIPYSWIVEKSDSSKIVILSYSEQDDWMVNYFKSFGASEVKNVIISSSILANDSSIIDEIKSARALFIKGGDQWKYISYWKGTKTEDAIKSIYLSGGVVAGTSAGAMILGEVVFSAQFGSIDSKQSLSNPLSSSVALEDDFLDLRSVLFDTHFIERGRFGRLISMMFKYYKKNNRNILGIGIDDKTALCIDKSGLATVFGSGAVSIFSFDNLTNITGETNEYSIENIFCNKLTNNWSYDFNIEEVVNYPESAIYIGKSEAIFLPKTDFYLTGQNSTYLNANFHLDSFLGSSFSGKIGIITESENIDFQKPIFDRLSQEKIESELVVISKDSVESTSIANQILECQSFIINFENYNLSSILSDSASNVGSALNKKINSKSNFILFGNNGKSAGELFVYNTDIDYLSSYYGRMRITSGINLFGDFIFQPMIFEDSDFYENRISALTYGMMRGRKRIGLYLDINSNTKIDAINKQIHVNGSTPLIVIDARGTEYIDSSSTKLKGGSGNRQVVAMNNLRYTISTINKVYSIENGSLTSFNNEFSNHQLSDNFEIYNNYPNPFNSQTVLSFRTNRNERIKIELFNILGEKVISVADNSFKQGVHKISIDFNSISINSATGIYFVRFSSTNSVKLQKVIYLK